MSVTQDKKIVIRSFSTSQEGGGVLLGILGGDVLPSSLNPRFWF